MLKTLFAVIQLLLFVVSAYSQKKLTVNLIVDSSINKDYISCRIDNGDKSYLFDNRNEKFIKDTLKISLPYYSEFATISIEHFSFRNDYYEYFINSKAVNFYLSLEKKDTVTKFKVTAPRNIIKTFDTVRNPVIKSLVKYVRFEREQVGNFVKENGFSFWDNDSLKNIFLGLSRKMLDKGLSFMSKHTYDYSVFYHFINNVQVSKRYYPKDTTYLINLKKYFLSNFPDKYINSIEGKKLLNELNYNFKETTLKVGDRSPYFTLTDVNNNPISSNDFQNNEYTLLHIWATWCSPCKAQMPKVVKLYNEYSKSKLKMISICTGSIIDNMKIDVIRYKLDWTNVFDRYNNIGEVFNSTSVPTYLLINKAQRIVYKGNDIDEVIKVLNDK